MVEIRGDANRVPERFVPEEMRGQLIEAEHLARYMGRSDGQEQGGS